MDLFKLGRPEKRRRVANVDEDIGDEHLAEFIAKDLEKQLAGAFRLPSSHPDQICAKGNDVYFHAPIEESTSFRLNMVLKDTIKKMQDVGNEYGISPPPIRLHINSPGGIVFGGLSVVDTIKASPVEIHSICEGAVASAATFISVSCKKRFIKKHAFMLIHQVSGGVWGKMEEIMDEADNIKRITSVIEDIYLKETKMSRSSLKKLLKHDLWMGPEECLQKGLVDKILE